jgi:hypothetical protein
MHEAPENARCLGRDLCLPMRKRQVQCIAARRPWCKLSLGLNGLGTTDGPTRALDAQGSLGHVWGGIMAILQASG